ncbi:MAG: outer membrane beta-barrel protein, partial [Myxococcota bacterium]
MMKRIGFVAALLVAFLAFPELAQAGDDSENGLGEIGVGLRTGGYGFRHVEGDTLAWNDCRMDGVGAFGTLDFTENLFVELGVDHYYATGQTVGSGMDRHSTFITAAAGARLLPDFFVSPFIQVGGGPEWTKIDVEGHSLRKVAPTAFLGLGGEINIESFHFGMNIRAYTMAHPLHG